MTDIEGATRTQEARSTGPAAAGTVVVPGSAPVEPRTAAARPGRRLWAGTALTVTAILVFAAVMYQMTGAQDTAPQTVAPASQTPSAVQFARQGPAQPAGAGTVAPLTIKDVDPPATPAPPPLTIKDVDPRATSAQ